MRSLIVGTAILSNLAGPVAQPGAMWKPLPVSLSVAPSATTQPASAGRYLPVFDQLVATIERQHVFAPRYEQVMGGSFADFVAPRLRMRMAAARNRSEAIPILSDLQNSIREAHCSYGVPAEIHPRWLTLGIKLHASTETESGRALPMLRVAGHEARRKTSDGKALATAIPIGSALTSVDGIEVGAWLAAHPYATNMLMPAIALQETADSIVEGNSERTALVPGTPRTLAFTRPDGAADQVSLAFAEPDEQKADAESAPEPDVDHPPATDAIECDASERSPYGPDYRLVASGVFVCVYAPVRGPKVPIVRYLSFYYTDGRRGSAAVLRQIKIDHDLLKSALADARGVILDLHKNHGGNNPFLFYRWFAKKPFSHEVVHTRVLPELTEWFRANSTKAELTQYIEAQKRGERFLDTRFLCLPPEGDPKGPPRCDDVPPSTKEAVTTAKVAVIVGPDCFSSCDTFALSWSQFGEGLIIGRQPSHAYTAQRHRFALTGPDREDLGSFCVGLTSSQLGSGPLIEGVPIKLDIEIPDRFENRETWIQEAVSQANQRLLATLID